MVTWLAAAAYLELSLPACWESGFVMARPGAPSPAVLGLLQLTSHQGLGLHQRHMAVLEAWVHLLHGHPAVLTVAGAAPDHEALHLPELALSPVLHHGVRRLLHRSSRSPALATPRCPTPKCSLHEFPQATLSFVGPWKENPQHPP